MNKQQLRIEIEPKVGLAEDRKQNLLESTRQIMEHLQACNIPQGSMLAEFNSGQGYHVSIFHREESPEAVQEFTKHMVIGFGPLPFDVNVSVTPFLAHAPEKEETWQQLDHNLEPIADGDLVDKVVLCSLPRLSPVDGDVMVRRKRRPKRRLRKPSLPPCDHNLLVPPPMTHVLAKIMRGCAIIREFREHPDLSHKYKWTWAARILMEFGNVGKDWIQHLSYLDAMNYDPKMVAHTIDDITHDGSQPLD